MRINGVVADRSGAPIDSAAVWLSAAPQPTPDIAQLTDVDGTFVLAAPVPGHYRVGVRAADAEPVEVDVEVGDTDVDVRVTVQTG